jgi:hypothetical protein
MWILLQLANKLAMGGMYKGTQTEAKNNIGAFLRCEEANPIYGCRPGTDITISGKYYSYSFSRSKNTTFIFAKLKSPNFQEFIQRLTGPDNIGGARSYVGGIFLLPANSDSKANFKSIICESRYKGYEIKPEALSPPFLSDGLPVCSSNTDAIY